VSQSLCEERIYGLWMKRKEGEKKEEGCVGKKAMKEIVRQDCR